MMPYVLTLFAYLLGSISTAIVTCKLMNLPDPRTTGSNNPGATNVLRVGGKKAAAITLCGDLLKGLVPVLLAKYWGLDLQWQFIVGFAAFLGHLYPLYYGFKGGKGVATAIGVYLGLNLWAALAVIATWLLIAKILKFSSLAALVATLLAPLFFYLFTQHVHLSIGLSGMTLLIYWRHRSNIRNLLTGKEGRIQPSDSRQN